jgi:hypothetical protein
MPDLMNWVGSKVRAHLLEIGCSALRLLVHEVEEWADIHMR